MSDFVEIGRTDDLADSSMKEISVQGQNILLAHIGGKYYATAGRCPHMGGHLSRGKLEGSVVTCPLHGSQFDLKDGEVVRWLKGSGFIATIGKVMKSPKTLTVYEVRIEDNRILARIPSG